MIKYHCDKCDKDFERYHDESENNHFCKPVGASGQIAMDNQTERERIIKEITSRMDWTVQDIEKIADWHLAEIARIIAPIKELPVFYTDHKDMVDKLLLLIDEVIRRAGGE